MFEAKIVLSTVDTAENAALIARALVNERLAACVGILPPMTSVFRWKEELHEDQESQMIIKTAADRIDALIRRLQEIHPYEVPEILALPVSKGLEAYLDWMESETR
jgi:periplasmic divalent cation tolerance protein